MHEPSGRIGWREWRYLLGVMLLGLVSFRFARADLLATGSGPLLPADYESPPDVALSRLDAAWMPWTTLPRHPIWALAALLPLALSLRSAVRIVRAHLQPMGTLSLLAVLGCALLQQFELAAAVLLLALLLSFIDWRELTLARAAPLYAALLASLAFWIAFGLATSDWHDPGLGRAHAALLLGYEFVRVPDFLRQVAIPWAHTLPFLGLTLLVLLALACLHAVRLPQATPPVERALLALLVLLLLAASAIAAATPRHETRYVFFLYPLALLLALTTVIRAAQTVLGASRAATAVAIVLCLVGFALMEDFQPQHLWNIGSARINFRIGMSPALVQHYHPRSEVRAAADYLAAHAVRGQDVVINAFPGVDFYYPGTDYFFMEASDPRFEGWSCRSGTRERWSDLPLLHSIAALSAEIRSGRRVWLVLEGTRFGQVMSRLPGGGQLEWTSTRRDIDIVSFRQAPSRN
jgi:hypothetical protein